ncbi:class I SAM-dependent methyltransferase [Nocardioides dongkuii]|uniref:class I SAM-dependent methyltransferase n=1 Tax=Nocardioides dongkuii TaxID=2760089 RepID=UPI0015FDB273|nr:class I SAM-dependent methyltransferase [Nocardioides dongkuii]
MDKDFWEAHWDEVGARAHGRAAVASPYLSAEIGDLEPGTALDAGCGEGAEAVWLAEHGWAVTAVDISARVLARAAEAAASVGGPGRVRFVEADLGTWEPATRFDLVTTHYAHPAMPQLAFYERIAQWVAPGGTLLVVGHLRTGETGAAHAHGHGHGQGAEDGSPPLEATVTAAAVTATLDPAAWDVVTAAETTRSLADGAGEVVELHDVVVRTRRRS